MENQEDANNNDKNGDINQIPNNEINSINNNNINIETQENNNSAEFQNTNNINNNQMENITNEYTLQNNDSINHVNSNNYNENQINTLNNNNNNNNNNQIIDEAQEIYNPKITFSFLFFISLNTLGFIHSFLNSYDLKNYSLCLWPILNKKQYYRLFASHFYHYGVFDFLTTMTGLYLITKHLEREIGSIYTIVIAVHGMIIASFLYLLTMWVFKSVLKLTEYNFIYQCGFSSVDFCLYMSYFLLKKNYRSHLDLSFIELRGIHSVYIVILIFQLITPSASLILNICGTFSAVIVFKINKYITLPKNDWVLDTEKFLGLNKQDNKSNILKDLIGYFSTTENDVIKKNLCELDYFFCKSTNRNVRVFNHDIENVAISRNNRYANNNQINNLVN